MADYILESRVWLARTRAEVFAFFADSSHLLLITPPAFRLCLVGGPTTLSTGAVLDMRLQWLGVPIRWRAFIREWDPPYRFVDVQVRGPYARWEHRHRFLEEGDGTWVEARVPNGLPFGRAGPPATRGSAGVGGRPGRRQAAPELPEPRPDAVGEEPQPRQIRDHVAVHVPLEVLAERRVVVRGRRLPAVALDLVDLLGAEAGVLVRLEREEAGERLLQREERVVLELAALGRRGLVDDPRQREHAEPHVARLVRQDALADRLQHGIARALAHHLEQGNREGLPDEL